jgi:hypothetical protein
MEILLFFLIMFVTFVILKSIKMPKPRTGQAITLFGRPSAYIGNIEGKKVNRKTGKITDFAPGESAEGNIYFFLWPFYQTYRYKFTYRKIKKIGEEQKEDTVIWKNSESSEIIVSRTGTSDHIEFRHNYPTVTPGLELKELGTVNVLTSNIIEIKDISKILFSVDNWLNVATDSIKGILRSIVAKVDIDGLNDLSSEKKADKFNKKMQVVNFDHLDNPGLETFGAEVIKSIFKEFQPADDKTRELMNSKLQIEITKNKVTQAITEQDGKSKIYEMQQDSEILKAYQKALKLGLIKVDDKGNVLELVPDPNTKILADNLGKLKDLTGTLVIGGETANLLNLNNK